MRSASWTARVLPLLVAFVVSIGWCADAAAAKKMPITTSSKKAMEYYLQGRALLEKLRAQEARSYFQRAVDEDPGFAVAYLQLAGTQPSAKAFFESFHNARALADEVTEAERLWILGFEAGAIQGDPMKQRELYGKLAKEYPGDARARFLLASNYFGQQEWEAAAKEYKQATRIDPEYSSPYNQMGYALRFLGRYDEAENVFRKYIELIPDDPNPYDSYAELLMKMGRFDESIQQYRKALSVQPDFVFSHVGIASDLVLLGRHDDARKELQVMYDEAKDDGQRRTALSAMAWSYMDEGRFDEALAQYRKQYALAEAIGDTSAMAGDLGLMGYALVEVPGREKEALAKFDEAAAMVQASSLSEATKEQNRLGHFYSAARVYVAMGDVESALANASEYRKQAEAARNSGQIKAAHQLYGLIALQEGEYDWAIEELMKSNLQNPYNLFYIGKAYEEKGDRPRAEEYYDRVAHFNGLNSSPQASVRAKAVERAAVM